MEKTQPRVWDIMNVDLAKTSLVETLDWMSFVILLLVEDCDF
jgi:hypothetical protein